IAPTQLFFFSSRRRHTRSKRDWSSDVCSSDLAYTHPTADHHQRTHQLLPRLRAVRRRTGTVPQVRDSDLHTPRLTRHKKAPPPRSEERRVGKEGSTRGGRESLRRRERRTA